MNSIVLVHTFVLLRNKEDWQELLKCISSPWLFLFCFFLWCFNLISAFGYFFPHLILFSFNFYCRKIMLRLYIISRDILKYNIRMYLSMKSNNMSYLKTCYMFSQVKFIYFSLENINQLSLNFYVIAKTRMT